MTESAKKTPSAYVKLSKTLNRIPNGFPEIEDGSHLRMLEWIFEPVEAELASKMKLIGETVEKMSKRLKIPINDLREKLEVMEEKGQILARNTKKGKKYGIYPFVVGIYEDQIHRMDEEFAQLFEDYVQKSKGDIIFN